MPEKDDLKRLEGLPADAKSRVEAVLKSAIERETVAGGLAGAAASSSIFSRGWIFSRLTPGVNDLETLKGLPGVAELDPAAFGDFATRLARLKAEVDPKR
jgi:hypothetical protein